MECEEAAKDIDENDEVSVDTISGVIKNITKNKTYKAVPFPEFMQKIIRSEGLINYIKGEVENK